MGGGGGGGMSRSNGASAMDVTPTRNMRTLDPLGKNSSFEDRNAGSGIGKGIGKSRLGQNGNNIMNMNASAGGGLESYATPQINRQKSKLGGLGDGGGGLRGNGRNIMGSGSSNNFGGGDPYQENAFGGASTFNGGGR